MYLFPLPPFFFHKKIEQHLMQTGSCESRCGVRFTPVSNKLTCQLGSEADGTSVAFHGFLCPALVL